MSEDHNILMNDNQKGFFFTLSVIFEKLRSDGIKTTLSKITKNIYYKIIGVDFDMQTLDQLTIKGGNKNLGTICGSSAEHTVQHILDSLVDFDKSILDGTFVDYGSGKGKLIIFAKNYGFQQCIGVEFAKELCEIATNNIKKLNIKDTTVVHGDAVDFTIPNDARVLYFLNPFHKSVFEQLLPKIISQSKKLNKELYIVYRAPIYNEVFQNYPEIKHLKKDYFRGDLTEFYQITTS